MVVEGMVLEVGSRVRLRQDGSSRRAVLACDNDNSLELLLDDGSEETVLDRSLVSNIEVFEQASDTELDEREVGAWKALGNKLFSELRDYEAADEYYQRGLQLIEPRLSIGQTVSIVGEAELTEAMIASMDGDTADLICLFPPEHEDEELDGFPCASLWPIAKEQAVLQCSLYLNRTRCLLKQTTPQAPASACICAGRAVALVQHASHMEHETVDDQLHFNASFLLAKALTRCCKLSEARKVASKLASLLSSCNFEEGDAVAKRLRQVRQLLEDIKGRKEVAKKSGKKLAKEVAKWVGSAMKGVECEDGKMKRQQQKKERPRLAKKAGGKWGAVHSAGVDEADGSGDEEVKMEDPEVARAHASRRAWLSFGMLVLMVAPALIGWLTTINGYMVETDAWHHAGVGLGMWGGYEEEVYELYATHNPSMLGKVPGLMRKWTGRERHLVRKIRKKYERGAKKKKGGAKGKRGKSKKGKKGTGGGTRKKEHAKRREEMDAEAAEHIPTEAMDSEDKDSTDNDDKDAEDDIIDLDVLDAATDEL
jgi:tetratricopeptide (TPR) repeat protein